MSDPAAPLDAAPAAQVTPKADTPAAPRIFGPPSGAGTDRKPSGWLQEPNGGNSSMRLSLLAWVAGVLGVWGFTSLSAWGSLATTGFMVIPEHVIEVLGILITGKVVQRVAETPEQQQPSVSNTFGLSPMEFLQEGTGDTSLVRIAMLLWVLGVLAFWVIGSLTTGKPLDLPPSITVLIGMLVTGKVAQKFKEG